MIKSKGPAEHTAGQSFIGGGGRASAMEARAKEKAKPYKQYADKFSYFFRRDFLVKRMFEVLNSEGKPEFVGFKQNCELLFPIFHKQHALPPDCGTLLDFLYDDMLMFIDVDRAARFLYWIGVVMPEYGKITWIDGCPHCSCAVSAPGLFCDQCGNKIVSNWPQEGIANNPEQQAALDVPSEAPPTCTSCHAEAQPPYHFCQACGSNLKKQAAAAAAAAAQADGSSDSRDDSLFDGEARERTTIPTEQAKFATTVAPSPRNEGGLLHEWREVPSTPKRWSSTRHAVPTHMQGAFAKYALEIYSTQTGSKGTVQLGSVKFLDVNGNTLTYDTISCNSEKCYGGGREHYRNLKDDSNREKWCASFESCSPFPHFEFTFSDPVRVSSVMLKSANDCPSRDPARFALFGIATPANEEEGEEEKKMEAKIETPTVKAAVKEGKKKEEVRRKVASPPQCKSCGNETAPPHRFCQMCGVRVGNHEETEKMTMKKQGREGEEAKGGETEEEKKEEEEKEKEGDRKPSATATLADVNTIYDDDEGTCPICYEEKNDIEQIPHWVSHGDISQHKMCGGK